MELIWVAIAGFVFLMALAVFIYQLPAEKFKRKRQAPPPPVKEQDWEGISKRWEKNNSVLNNEIASLKKERKAFIEQIEDIQKIVKEQVEQLAREKAWREKESQVVEKVKNIDHELKEELRRSQNTLNEGHSLKLRMDIELQESRITISKLKEEVRSLTVRLMAVEREAEGSSKELRELRRTNTELKKQKEDIQWVAKSDYDEILLKFKKAESELQVVTSTARQVDPPDT